MTYRLQEHSNEVLLIPTAKAPSASVIWLHGLGADGQDFVPIVPQLRLPANLGVRFVFPHAPVRAVSLNQGMKMRAWYDITQLSRGAAEDVGGISDSSVRLSEYLRRERDQGIPANRIVIAGFSQGGAMALHSGLRFAERLAGVLALSTYLPLCDRLALEASAANRDIPILMCHGRYDPIVSIELALSSREALLQQGFAVQWREYPMRHEVCTAEIDDIAQWLRQLLA